MYEASVIGLSQHEGEGVSAAVDAALTWVDVFPLVDIEKDDRHL